MSVEDEVTPPEEKATLAEVVAAAIAAALSTSKMTAKGMPVASDSALVDASTWMKRCLRRRQNRRSKRPLIEGDRVVCKDIWEKSRKL